MAAATVAVLDSERLVGQEALAGSRLRLGLLQRQLIIAEAGAKFTQADLDKVIGQIEQQREQLERELAEVAAPAARCPPGAGGGAGGIARVAGPRRGQLRPDPGPWNWFRSREAQLEAADTATYVLRLHAGGCEHGAHHVGNAVRRL